MSKIFQKLENEFFRVDFETREEREERGGDLLIFSRLISRLFFSTTNL